MKPALRLLLLTVLFHLSFTALAQDHYQLTGTVVNEKNEPVEGATVFISGSKQVTPTKKDGRFTFADVPHGAVKLVVKMLGYAPATNSLNLDNANTDVKIQLEPKTIELKEVAIGGDRNWNKNFELFKDKFLGHTDNAKSCVILNPKVINFSTRKGLLVADADDFLIIENKRLGYRINYLLQQFEHNLTANVSEYKGEFNFEEMDGSTSQQKTWAKNRAETYKGSFMHFLRTVYANNTLENGFLVRALLRYGTFREDTVQDRYKLVVIDSALDLTTQAIDSNFRSVFFNKLYVMYNPKKAAAYRSKTLSNIVVKPETNIVRDLDASVLMLNTCEAIIDKKGSYTNHHSFLITGYWGQNRMGDELPVDYEPPVVRGVGNVRIE